jgi:hypothetical protein
MYKKIAILALAFAATSVVYAGTMPVVYPEYNTISFTLNDKITVKSDTALVQVTVNATALSGNQATAENAALQTVKKALPNVQWQVVNYNQTRAQSGAMNIRIEIQGRLTQLQIQTLNKTLERYQSPNQKLTSQVLNYSPTVESISQAKMALMIQMYNKIQNYLKTFNQQPNRHYHIQNISYNSDQTPQPRTASPMVQMAVADHAQSNLSVSEDVKISAYISFAEKAS